MSLKSDISSFLDKFHCSNFTGIFFVAGRHTETDYKCTLVLRVRPICQSYVTKCFTGDS